ncbi:FAD-dependent oxidoreductase [Desulfolucanica intricata]|uniref:FAD-dependent oxidoreductase n=1 Tax=Desulfolucanica intricata TaxID=1285191 RepID=UPI0009EE5271|nr:FAD-dependent oxidoreductase [Desulfolucanica intricata]
MRFPKLFEEGYIGNMQLRNRTVMPAMGTNLASEIGGVTPAMIHYYRERAKGGVGLIITEINSVDTPQGHAVTNQLSIHNNSYIAGHNELVEAVKEHGAKIITQLHHAGRATTTENTLGLQPVAPSAVPDPTLNVVPRELTVFEIEEIIEKFVKAAVRAQHAGYDGIELHGAHGYLINQFMSAFSNKRTDLYGGDLSGRMRFPLEIIKGIKQETGGNFPIVFRYSADEFVEGGINLEEAKQIARMLQAAGVDALNISSGVYASMQTILEPMSYPEGWRVYLAENIKREVHIPVITVGVIRSPETAEAILKEGRADFIALGRTLIADPEWPLKAMEDRPEDIRKCITCNIWCVGERVLRDLHIRCTVNPAAGREHEYPYIPSTLSPRHFAVIGGGPAGMEAARVLSIAGHSVTLFEKEPELGGQVKLACMPPGKEKIRWSTDYLQTQIRKLGVDIRLNTEVNAGTLQGMDISAVILATGAAPLIPDIAGVHNKTVTTAWDVLAGRYQVGNKVVIIGGGSVGCETALFLKHRGVDVTVVEMEDELAVDTEPISRVALLEELRKSGVNTLTGFNVREIKPDGVIALDKKWKEHWIPCTHAVLSVGAISVNHLEQELKQRGMRVFVIGDAKKPRKLNMAISEAFLTAQRISRAETPIAAYHPFSVQQYQELQQEQYMQ